MQRGVGTQPPAWRRDVRLVLAAAFASRIRPAIALHRRALCASRRLTAGWAPLSVGRRRAACTPAQLLHPANFRGKCGEIAGMLVRWTTRAQRLFFVRMQRAQVAQGRGARGRVAHFASPFLALHLDARDGVDDVIAALRDLREERAQFHVHSAFAIRIHVEVVVREPERELRAARV
jgi:hypothetical protein